MLPVKLSIEGLQSYSEKVEIDFEKFHKNRLFGIFGDTGAGKSTILDAIILAIYGKTPRLGGKNLHEAINPTKDRIKINFIFKISGRQYLIERSIGKDSKCKLYEVKDNVKIPKAEKSKEFEDAIRQIIGLEHEEFCKVVILPQNQFAEILKIKPADRAQLLGNLFDLNVFGEPLSEVVKNLANKTQLEKSSVENRLKELEEISEKSIKIKEEEIEKATINLKELENQQKQLSEKLELINRFHELNNQKIELEHALAELKKKSTEIEKLKEKIKIDEEMAQYKIFYNEWINLKSSIEANLKIKQEIQESLEKISEKLNKISKQKEDFEASFVKKHEDLIRTIADAEEAIRISKKIEQLKAEQQEIERNISLTKENQKKIEKEIQKITNEVEKLKALISDNQNKFKEISLNEEEEQLYNLLPEVLPKVNEIKNLEVEIDKLKTTLTEAKKNKESLFREIAKMLLHKLQITITDSEEILSTIEIRKQQLENLLDEKRKTLKELELKNMAITLSRQLTEGKPCPVCGSTLHPQPASGEIEEKIKNMENEIIVIENQIKDIETFKKDIKPHLNEIIETNVKISQTENDIKEKTETLSKLKEKLFNIFPNEHFPHALEIFNQLKERKRNCEKLMTDLNKLNNQFNEKNNLLNEKLNMKTQMSVTLEQLKPQLERLNKEIGQNLDILNQKTKGKNPEDLKKEAETELNNLKNTKENLEKFLKSKEKDKQERELQLQKIKTELENEQTRYNDINKRLTEKANEKGVSINQLKNFFLDEKLKEKIKKEVENYEKERNSKSGALLQIIKQIEELQIKELPTGEPDKTKIALETVRKNIAELNKKLGALHENIEREKELLKEKAQLIETLTSLEKNFKNIKTLENIIRGKEMVKFFSWYLIKDIVSLSNKLLEELIGRRFYLTVSQNLEFTIKDLFYNSTRSVATLSGGETFIVSFALALALSYYIQHRRRRPVQFFFIDEGFSSLDKDLLDSLCSILNELRSQDRLVGLISHLEELKQIIPEHIYVYREKTGSSKIKYFSYNNLLA
ncbi:Exonuclease SbcC [Thermodesulfovibrio sp. N1]|uniref:SbcC/MukB-like Walker B domain-containing protein n=1 Tax=Thermodesulfovibrio sp. N1 TaxID=1871110 RepID=UPI000839E264|nr:SbcC/MukB-like Walker B domain-containing protein [Thermodesulfovibrio sp. N1]ODA43718.1 Exonuclease SbcC [Thermodesulfovibrio sp. N1]